MCTALQCMDFVDQYWLHFGYLLLEPDGTSGYFWAVFFFFFSFWLRRGGKKKFSFPHGLRPFLPSGNTAHGALRLERCLPWSSGLVLRETVSQMFVRYNEARILLSFSQFIGWQVCSVANDQQTCFVVSCTPWTAHSFAGHPPSPSGGALDFPPPVFV